MGKAGMPGGIQNLGKDNYCPIPTVELPTVPRWGQKDEKSLRKEPLFLSMEILHPALLLGSEQRRLSRTEAEGNWENF